MERTLDPQRNGTAAGASSKPTSSALLLRAALVAHGEDLARTAATLRISVRGLELRLRERRPRPS